MITRANVSEETWSDPLPTRKIDEIPYSYTAYEYNRQEPSEVDTNEGIKRITQSNYIIIDNKSGNILSVINGATYNENYICKEADDELLGVDNE